MDSRKKPKIRLLNRDCLDGLKKLEAESIDLVVTSPPYNLGIDYNIYNDSQSRKSYLNWMKEWGREVKRVLSDKGSVFLNLGSKPSDLWVPHEVLFTLRDVFELQNEIHWIKSIAAKIETEEDGENINFGHYKPVNSKRFINQCHEYIFHLTKNGDVRLDRLAVGVPYKHKSNVSRWKSNDRDLRCRGNTWFIPYDTINSRRKDRPHPASFPPALAAMAMRLHGTDRISRAMDPFLGIGSSALAAQKLGIDFIGFEIDKQYLQTARSRLKNRQPELF